MADKLSGSAIQPGTISITQISGSFSNTVNAAYGQANSAYGAANNRVLKTGDTMTGQLNISSGGLLVTGNSNFDTGTLFVDSVNDYVGIGTTSPISRLTAAQASAGTPSLGSATYYGTTFVNNFGGYGLGVNVNSGSGIVLLQSQRFDGTATAYDIALNPFGGNVNIGASTNYGGLLSINRSQSGSPSLARMLTLRDASSGSLVELNFYGDPTFGTASRFDFTGQYLAFTVSGTNRMRIMNGGNVGIGVDNPLSLLHVNGTARSKFVYVVADGTNDSAEFGNSQSNLRIGGDGANMRINTSPWGLSIITGSGVAITGSLSKSSGSFKIDHPLPEKSNTHYLVHSFIEGPQADLIYSGRAQLENGLAIINIDAHSNMTEGTFVLLNRDIRCFTTNESDWDAVRGSVNGNILTIQCQNPSSNAIVSWMVIGERQDSHMMNTGWTDENGRVIVEPEKTTLD